MSRDLNVAILAAQVWTEPRLAAQESHRVVEAGSFDEATELLRVLYPALLATARTLYADAEAEDLVQETLASVLSTHPLFTGLEYPLGYCRTVLLRLSSKWRYLWRRAVPINEDLVNQLDDPRAARVENKTLDSMVVSGALSHLPPRQKVCIYLRFFEGLGDSEIAKILGCRESTVRSQISRGLGAMKNALTQEPPLGRTSI